ncbi:DUF4870 domain-containing protein [bacterium]|nr:DUF4870 domain-containing protein [bacterium]
MVEKKTDDERTWAMFCHLSALATFIGIPFGGVILPLIIWLMKRNDSELIDANGKESVNFQISVLIYMIASGLLCLVVIGFILLPIILIADLVLVIMASVKISAGEEYKYPFSIHFIS